MATRNVGSKIPKIVDTRNNIIKVLIETDVPGHHPPVIMYSFEPFADVDFGEFMKDIARKFKLPFMEGVEGEMQFELKRKKEIRSRNTYSVFAPFQLYDHFGVLSRKESRIDFISCGEEVSIVNDITMSTNVRRKYDHYGVLSCNKRRIDFICGEEVHVVSDITGKEPN